MVNGRLACSIVGLQSISKQITTPKMRQPLAKYAYLLTSPTLLLLY